MKKETGIDYECTEEDYFTEEQSDEIKLKLKQILKFSRLLFIFIVISSLLDIIVIFTEFNWILRIIWGIFIVGTLTFISIYFYQLKCLKTLLKA